MSRLVAAAAAAMVAGLALASRPTYFALIPSVRKRGSTNDQAPMFSDSSCAHTTSRALVNRLTARRMSSAGNG